MPAGRQGDPIKNDEYPRNCLPSLQQMLIMITSVWPQAFQLLEYQNDSWGLVLVTAVTAMGCDDDTSCDDRVEGAVGGGGNQAGIDKTVLPRPPASPALIQTSLHCAAVQCALCCAAVQAMKCVSYGSFETTCIPLKYSEVNLNFYHHN